MRSLHVCFPSAALAAIVFSSVCWGQGLIVDHRPHIPIRRSYEVRQVRLEGDLRDQAAQMRLSQTFHNPGSFTLEAQYLFPVPDGAAIENFVLLVDGREIPARLLSRDQARRIYEQIVRRRRDPALLEYIGQGLIRTSVFPIPPGADRTVTMRYTQLCRRNRELVEFNYPFGTQRFTAKPIRHLSVTLHIESREPIKSVYSPSHDVSVQRRDDHHATVRLDQHDVVPRSDFRLLYTLAGGEVAASLLSYRPSGSDDGYFLLLASPRVHPAEQPALPKTVLFVLDRSGSMSGKKIEQAKGALKFVLNNLRPGDTFNIVVYDDRVESFKPELQRYSDEARDEAVRYVENIYAGGSTNIDEALRVAMGMLKDRARPSYVLFLTDGKPTAGEQRETAIARNCRQANRAEARLFVFGVGYDVNARLLDRLSGGNGGTSVYVRPNEDIERYVSDFYARLSAPVLTGIRIRVLGVDVNRTYPRDIPDLFDGSQLVWVGRYRQSGPATVRITGRVGEQERSFEFAAELARPQQGHRYAFVEKLWAMRRIGFILDQIDLHGKNRELIDELVNLSRRYGIITPYTAFLADERDRLRAMHYGQGRTAAEQSLELMKRVDGRSGTAQRRFKQALLGASQPFPVADMVMPLAPGTAGGGLGGFGAMGHGAVLFTDAEGNQRVARGVRHIGNKTFYQRGKLWVDAEVKPNEESGAKRIEQYSDEYFALARRLPGELKRCLAFSEPVLVKFGNQVYRIVLPAK